MFGYGTITVNGTGGVRTPIKTIDQPLEFRRHAVATVDAAQSTPVEDLYAETVGAFDFAAGRGERPILVRAFDPTAERDGYERPGSVLQTNT